MEEIFYDIFNDLPRQGPGDKQSTRKAINLIETNNLHPRILDIGCGTGMQTFELAHQIGGEIFAVDNNDAYLNELTQRASKFGYTDNIQVLNENMNNLPFPEKYFDLIWAEGSIYIMGFGSGLKYLQTFLKKNGYIAATEISWLRDEQPQTLKDFWRQEYAEMHTVEENEAMIRECGYHLVESFVLPSSAWWDNFYNPLEKRLRQMRIKYLDNDQALELVEFVQLEIDLYRKYPDFYGYVFYIMQLK